MDKELDKIIDKNNKIRITLQDSIIKTNALFIDLINNNTEMIKLIKKIREK